MGSGTVLLLDSASVAELLDYPSCIDAVETAFRLHAQGTGPHPAICGVHVDDGGFHVKAAALGLGRKYFAAKTNANFPGNPEHHGLPTIQGVVVLFDASDGRPLVIMDSGEVTVRRTAAATAVAARHLARPDSSTATVCGCGVQGRAQLEALSHVLDLQRVFAFDRDPQVAESFAADMSLALGMEVVSVTALAPHARLSDVCVTCTPSRSFLLGPDDVAEGAFVAGVGADNPDKRELHPDLMARSTIVVDILEQCAEIGDLHHALEAGALTRDSVRAELGEIVAGHRSGRSDPEDVIIFDSTGTALQDVAAGAVIYERALEAGRGHSFAMVAAGTRTGSPATLEITEG